MFVNITTTKMSFQPMSKALPNHQEDWKALLKLHFLQSAEGTWLLSARPQLATELEHRIPFSRTIRHAGFAQHPGSQQPEMMQ